VALVVEDGTVAQAVLELLGRATQVVRALLELLAVTVKEEAAALVEPVGMAWAIPHAAVPVEPVPHRL